MNDAEVEHISIVSGENHLKPAVLCVIILCDALRDLVAFVQFKKREKHPWRSVDFNKVAGFSQQLY